MAVQEVSPTGFGEGLVGWAKERGVVSGTWILNIHMLNALRACMCVCVCVSDSSPADSGMP